jgi:anti-sigma factor (TIGR02949 family)
MTSDATVGAKPSREIDCVHVIRRLWDYLDGRVAEEEHEQIVAHLAWCNGCASHYQFEQEFLSAVGRLRRNGENYDELKSQIMSRLRALGLDNGQ